MKLFFFIFDNVEFVNINYFVCTYLTTNQTAPKIAKSLMP